MISRLLFILYILLVSVPMLTGQPMQNDILNPRAVRENNAAYVDTLLKTLSLKEKIGQLFVTKAYGQYESNDSERLLELERKVTEDHVGGVIFMAGDIYEQIILTNRLQRLSKIPLLISQDMEYGPAMRLYRASRFTPAMGIAATGNPDNAYLAGLITAREAKALGVHQIYAPVADINNNPDNPIINVRSFSESPQMVSTYASSFMYGVLAEGLMPTAKHFPGHGDTDTDSHIDLPVIRYDYKRLDSLELSPFKTLIENGIPSIMSAHISFPELSMDPETPGTLDRDVLGRILLDSLGYEGIVVSDALDMEAVSNRYSPGEAARMALLAGIDMLLISIDEHAAINELERSVRNGKISEERIDESVRKILAWKIQLGLFSGSLVDLDRAPDVIDSRNHKITAERIARESITLLKNQNGVIPVYPREYDKVMVIVIADDDSGDTGKSLLRTVRAYHPNVEFGLYDKRTPDHELEQIIRKASKADLIIVGSFVYVRMAAKIQFSRAQRSFIRRIEKLKPPKMAIAFGNPYVLSEFEDFDVHISAWSAANQQVYQTVPGLFGAEDIFGHLPISIPNLYNIGDGIGIKKSIIREDAPELVRLNYNRLRSVDDIIAKAIEDSVFPGAQLAVLRNGVLAWNKGYGYHTYEKVRAVKNTDLYDLASLTKVMATTSSVMMLIDEGKLKLNDRVSKFFPEYNEGQKSRVTIRHLLEHQSGLPPFRLYIDSLKSREEIVKAVLNEPLIEKAGTETIYSDLGFITLGAIVEKITGERLDKFINKKLFYPSGMIWTMYRPHRFGNNYVERSAPTEVDTVYRKQEIKAYVHDERAYYMDEVAGHAGLFSRASDVAIFADILLREGNYAGIQFFKPKTVQRFTIRSSKNPERALGFDLKNQNGFSSAGILMSGDTFGHTGFTGTSLWIDPKKDLAVVLLTNRTHPYRTYGSQISQVRAAVADAVMRALDE